MLIYSRYTWIQWNFLKNLICGCVSEKGMGRFNREDYDEAGNSGSPRWVKHGQFQSDFFAWPCLIANKNSEIRIPSQKGTLAKVEGPQIYT